MPESGDPFGEIVGLFLGTVKTPWPGQEPTAIAKTATDAPVRVTYQGLEGDTQADKKAHGGPDQAIHHYASEHMPFWVAHAPDQVEVFKPGCFGENISTTGLSETNICVGDVLTLGTAKVQVSQGRQPCWKLNAHIAKPDIAYQFRNTGHTGWYYRVLEQGVVTVGDYMNVIERPAPDWPLEQVIKAFFSPKLDASVAERLTNLVHLSKEWRAYFASLTQA